MGEQPGAAIEGFLFRNPDFPLGISLFENPEPAFILLPIDICGFQSYLRDFSANHKYRTRKTTRSNSLPRPTQNSRRIRSLRTDRPPGPAKIPERAPMRLLRLSDVVIKTFFPSRQSCTKPTFEFSQKKFPQKKLFSSAQTAKPHPPPLRKTAASSAGLFPIYERIFRTPPNIFPQKLLIHKKEGKRSLSSPPGSVTHRNPTNNRYVLDYLTISEAALSCALTSKSNLSDTSFLGAALRTEDLP